MNEKQKGITLIALIITIIVMLILVAVTINVALNGGLFEKAKNAAQQTQKEADREELLSAVFGTLDNNGKLQVGISRLKQGLSDGWNVETIESDEEFLKCTSPKNTILYVEIDTGKILDKLPNRLVIAPSELILLGEGSSDTVTLTSIGTFDGNVTWSVTPTGVVTVEGNNSSATITAVANSGTATITATRDGVEAVLNVTVNDPNVWYNVTFSTIDSSKLASMFTTREFNNDVDYRAYFVNESEQYYAFSAQRLIISGDYHYAVGVTSISTNVSYLYDFTEGKWVNQSDNTDIRNTIVLTKVKVIPGATIGGNVLNDEDLPDFMSRVEWSE